MAYRLDALTLRFRLVDVLNKAGYPGVPAKDSKGTGVDELIKTAPTVYIAEKSKKIFGPQWKYRALEESVSDLGKDFQERGWWN
jgi:hypothetical protein